MAPRSDYSRNETHLGKAAGTRLDPKDIQSFTLGGMIQNAAPVPSARRNHPRLVASRPGLALQCFQRRDLVTETWSFRLIPFNLHIRCR